ncbi:hypothetical protein ATCC90586_010081 [Pythium insidiosum]|nr:hypothetical protein ATCC90586_010081 [Pythium insidiosum]
MPKAPCASAAPPPPPPPPPSALEANADAAMDAKDNATLVKDTLSKTANLSAVDATIQLRVLCRKFAALTEKVKDETRIREEAEREVRRLKALLEGNDAPVIASTRSEAHALIKELKESQERLKQELRQEKEKNALLVSRALELEKEKNALLSSTSAVALHGVNNRTSTENNQARVSSSWDREQSQKIHATLATTIDELQEELTRKEAGDALSLCSLLFLPVLNLSTQEELQSWRDRLQRERAQIKSLEQDLRDRDDSLVEAQRNHAKLEQQIEEQRRDQTDLRSQLAETDKRLEEEHAMRCALDEQIETLNSVNAALEQRAKALVRRIELGQAVIHECEDLKSQLHDVEVDKETLVRSIKDLKDQHFAREAQWKCQIEQVRAEKSSLQAQIAELEGELASVRTQNTLLSEWMLVRQENANASASSRQAPQLELPTKTSACGVTEVHGDHP